MQLKQRIEKLEQSAGSGLVEVPGLGYFYGDAGDVRMVPRAEFKRHAERGLAGFYDDLDAAGFRPGDPKLRIVK